MTPSSKPWAARPWPSSTPDWACAHRRRRESNSLRASGPKPMGGPRSSVAERSRLSRPGSTPPQVQQQRERGGAAYLHVHSAQDVVDLSGEQS